MVRTLRTINALIILFAIAHILLGLVESSATRIAGLWFIGSGIAILLFALQNLGAIDRVVKDQIISRNWILANAIVLVFIAYACFLLPEAQNFVLLTLVLANVSLSIALILKDSNKWCCTDSVTA